MLYSTAAYGYCTQSTITGYNLDPACYEPRPGPELYNPWYIYEYPPEVITDWGYDKGGEWEELSVRQPTSCGVYRYWDGYACADARWFLPYIGPRW